jgi:hypothetical protein
MLKFLKIISFILLISFIFYAIVKAIKGEIQRDNFILLGLLVGGYVVAIRYWPR